MYPTVVGEFLWQVGSCPDLRPRERARFFECFLNFVTEVLIRKHWSRSTRAVPVGTFAFRANRWFAFRVFRNPFMPAPLTSVSHNSDRNLCHVILSQYIPAEYISRSSILCKEDTVYYILL